MFRNRQGKSNSVLYQKTQALFKNSRQGHGVTPSSISPAQCPGSQQTDGSPLSTALWFTASTQSWSNLSASWMIYRGVGCSSKQRSGMQKCLCSNQFPMWNPATQGMSGCFSASVRVPKSPSKAQAFLDVLLKLPGEWKELAEEPSCPSTFPPVYPALP